MKEIFPKLKSRGFYFDRRDKSWRIDSNRLTSRQRSNVDKLLDPYVSGQRRTRKDEIQDSISDRKTRGLAVAIPYDLRGEAKGLGGLWDPRSKMWVMPDEESKAKVLGMAREYEAKIRERKEQERKEREEQYAQERKEREDRKERERQRKRERLSGYVVLHQSSRDRGGHFPVGHVFRDRKSGDVLRVVEVESTYYPEDGMSFGLMMDRGWGHTLYCEPAGEGEASAIKNEEKVQRSRSEAKRRVDVIEKMIVDRNDHPKNVGRLNGDVVLERDARLRPYGGGSWFVIQRGKAIWFVRNNGSDGGNWSFNNVQTGGAGAIGYRFPYDAKLADEMRQLDKIIH